MISKQDILDRASGVLVARDVRLKSFRGNMKRAARNGQLTDGEARPNSVDIRTPPLAKPIRFAFDEEKFVQTLALLASKSLPELTTLKVAKLLFLADKKHFTTYGRPILGDRYVGMKNGPCPSAALQLMNGAVKENAPPVGATVRALVDKYLKVDPTRGTNAVFVPRREPDLEVFSRSELRVLGDVIREHGQKTGRQLVDETHEDPGYKIAWEKRGSAKSADMPYELFFEGAPRAVEKLKRLVAVEQEDHGLVPAR
jgi:uncharacterized phage-associated protein